jgi:polyhydroxybutyrate depolymerase
MEDKSEDGTTVTRKVYRPKPGGAEVILVEIEGGGHTWPGKQPLLGLIGRSTQDISANDMIWEFFHRHRRDDKKGDILLFRRRGLGPKAACLEK